MTTHSTRALNLEGVEAAWHALTQHVPLGPILTEADYTQRVRMLDTLLDVMGANDAHPLGDLLDLLATQIEAYERPQPTMPEATPIEVLRYLMEEHGLTQTELAEDLGGSCRKVRFLGQNPKTWYQEFNELQTPKLSKKQLCDRTTRSLFLDGLSLYRVRPDKAYSLTDCMSMQVMRRAGLTDVLTNDHHFTQEGFHILFP